MLSRTKCHLSFRKSYLKSFSVVFLGFNFFCVQELQAVGPTGACEFQFLKSWFAPVLKKPGNAMSFRIEDQRVASATEIVSDSNGLPKMEWLPLSLLAGRKMDLTRLGELAVTLDLFLASERSVPTSLSVLFSGLLPELDYSEANQPAKLKGDPTPSQVPVKNRPPNQLASHDKTQFSIAIKGRASIARHTYVPDSLNTPERDLEAVKIYIANDLFPLFRNRTDPLSLRVVDVLAELLTDDHPDLNQRLATAREAANWRRSRDEYPVVVDSPTKRSGPVMKLSNFGDRRYFSFIPDGQAENVLARVNDIAMVSSEKTFGIIAEFIQPEMVRGETIWRRRVKALTATELVSISNFFDVPRELGDSLFGALVAPKQLAIQKLAEALKLKTYTTSMGRRGWGEKEGFRGAFHLYSEWVGLGANFSRFYLHRFESVYGAENLQRFIEAGKTLTGAAGKPTATLNLTEKFSAIANTFANLDAKEVIDLTPRGQTDLAWVITEDGALRIIPAFDMVASNFNLAGYRRIFAAGRLKLNPEGRADVEVDSTDYLVDLYGRRPDQGQNVRTGFYVENPSEFNLFIATVFKSEAGLDITQITEANMKYWGVYSNQELYWLLEKQEWQTPGYTPPDLTFKRAENAIPLDELRRRGFAVPGANELVDRIQSLTLTEADHRILNELAWDQKGDNTFPPQSAEWNKRFVALRKKLKADLVEVSDAKREVLWAYTVLGAEPLDSLETIVYKSRKLNSKYRQNDDHRNPMFAKYQDARIVIRQALRILKDFKRVMSESTNATK